MLGNTEPFKGADTGVCMPFVFPGVDYSEASFCGPSVPLVTFLGVLVAYPNAGLEFIFRNFNRIEPPMGPLPLDEPSRMSVCVAAYLPSDREKPGFRSKSEIFSDNANLSRMLPREIMDMLRNSTDERTGGRVGADAIISIGQTIADSLKREVTLVHQYGGNMEYAMYDIFEPFYPGGDGKIEILRHIDSEFR